MQVAIVVVWKPYSCAECPGDGPTYNGAWEFLPVLIFVLIALPSKNAIIYRESVARKITLKSVRLSAVKCRSSAIFQMTIMIITIRLWIIIIII